MDVTEQWKARAELEKAFEKLSGGRKLFSE